MERYRASRFRIRRLPEVTAGHIRTDEFKVGAVKQIKDFSLGFELYLLAKEPWCGKELGHVQVHVVVPGFVIGVTSEITFHAEGRGRELGCRGRWRSEDPVQEVFLVFARQMSSECGYVGNVVVIAIAVVIAASIPYHVAALVKYRGERSARVNGEWQTGLQQPHATDLPVA